MGGILNSFVFLIAIWGFKEVVAIRLKTYRSVRNGTVRYFPDNFMFGTSTAAYQIEGGYKSGGKTQSIWDYIVETNSSFIADKSNGNIADDSYNKYKRDVEMLRELGVDFYRFSISWPRILSNGFADQINKEGVKYYKNLINELLKYDIKPIVTIYHWDLPQKLQELGGWVNPLIVDWYSDYARVLFSLFGDKVKTWITVNEPQQICNFGYGTGLLAPGIRQDGIANYICSKNVLVAHATAYNIYDKEFRSTQGGIIGISISGGWYEPLTEADTEAAEIYYDFEFGQYAHPIFTKEGNWPQSMRDMVAVKSKKQGYPRSRLPQFTDEEVELIRGSSDFLGLNHYTSEYAYKNDFVKGMYAEPSFDDDIGVASYTPPRKWPIAATSWLSSVPWGFTKLLYKIRDTYNNPPVYVTENGYSTSAVLEDTDRIFYYRSYWNALVDALDDGVNVKAYSVWSLMDNLEWASGYTERFGLYQVDYGSDERTRTPRKSAFIYKELIRSHKLDWNYDSNSSVMTIDGGYRRYNKDSNKEKNNGGGSGGKTQNRNKNRVTVDGRRCYSFGRCEPVQIFV